MTLQKHSKVVSASTMAKLENQAYLEGCEDHLFMENAGQGIANHLLNYLEIAPQKILLLCGKGNNAGDTFVAGIFLLQQGYLVDAIQPLSKETCTPLCQNNRQRFIAQGGRLVTHLDWSSYSLIVDGIFGTGFKGSVEEPYASLIQAANRSEVPIFAVDIPSGLNGSTGQVESIAITAHYTIFLGLPKLGFFLEQGWNYVGKLLPVDFGLPQHLVDQLQTNFSLLTAHQVAEWLPPLIRNRHKYQAGYVIGLAGDMPGAALLASLAAFRGGSGMVRLLHSAGMETALANSPYELIKFPFDWQDTDAVIQTLNKATANFIGPGLGRHSQAAHLLQKIIPGLKKPCVLDADGLFHLANLDFDLPANTILTPHTGEMQYLLKQDHHLQINQETLNICQDYAKNKKVTILLKGAPTFILQQSGPIFINPTGDPGMATAGSGDVLTGLLASFLSQHVACEQAAALGAYLHGLAGEYAAEDLTSYSLMASDLTYYFSSAFKKLKHEKNFEKGLF